MYRSYPCTSFPLARPSSPAAELSRVSDRVRKTGSITSSMVMNFTGWSNGSGVEPDAGLFAWMLLSLRPLGRLPLPPPLLLLLLEGAPFLAFPCDLLLPSLVLWDDRDRDSDSWGEVAELLGCCREEACFFLSFCLSSFAGKWEEDFGGSNGRNSVAFGLSISEWQSRSLVAGWASCHSIFETKDAALI